MAREQNPSLEQDLDDEFETPIEIEKQRRIAPRGLMWGVTGAIVTALFLLMLHEIDQADQQVKAESEITWDSEPVGVAPSVQGIDDMLTGQRRQALAEKRAEESQNAEPVVAPTIAVAAGPVSPVPVVLQPMSATMTPEQATNEQIIRNAPIVLLSGNDSFGSAAPSGDEYVRNELERTRMLQMGGMQADETEAQRRARAIAGQGQGDMGDGGFAGGGAGATNWLMSTAQAATNDYVVPRELVSRRMVLQGTKIPVVNMQRINSDLPGSIQVMVNADVYDTLTQRHKLIPKGSRMYGRYNSDISVGQERVMMAFTRLVTPDGRTIDLSGAQGVDGMGQSGWTGDVNNHFFKMFTSSFATAFLADWFDNRASKRNSGTTINLSSSPSSSADTAAGQTVVDIAGVILDRNRNIPPTITVEEGQQFFVDIQRDIAFP